MVYSEKSIPRELFDTEFSFHIVIYTYRHIHIYIIESELSHVSKRSLRQCRFF